MNNLTILKKTTTLNVETRKSMLPYPMLLAVQTIVIIIIIFIISCLFCFFKLNHCCDTFG